MSMLKINLIYLYFYEFNNLFKSISLLNLKKKYFFFIILTKMRIINKILKFI